MVLEARRPENRDVVLLGEEGPVPPGLPSPSGSQSPIVVLEGLLATSLDTFDFPWLFS